MFQIILSMLKTFEWKAPSSTPVPLIYAEVCRHWALAAIMAGLLGPAEYQYYTNYPNSKYPPSVCCIPILHQIRCCESDLFDVPALPTLSPPCQPCQPCDPGWHQARECASDIKDCICVLDEMDLELELFCSRWNISTACPSGSELRVTVVTTGEPMCSCVKSFNDATIPPDKQTRGFRKLKESVEEKRCTTTMYTTRRVAPQVEDAASLPGQHSLPFQRY
jgi:hypothetical protein